MRLPGTTTPGTDVDNLTRHIDLFPTLAEFAGADIPAGLDLDGRSLMPLITNPKAAWSDRYTFFHKGRWGKKGASSRWAKGHCDPDQAKYETFAVRNERWRLVGKEALYDIETDPGEEHNVIAEHREVADQMLAAYDAWWDEVRPLMVNEDAPLDVEKPFIVQFNKQKEETGIPDWLLPEL
jgi:arylsulfatase